MPCSNTPSSMLRNLRYPHATSAPPTSAFFSPQHTQSELLCCTILCNTTAAELSFFNIPSPFPSSSSQAVPTTMSPNLQLLLVRPSLVLLFILHYSISASGEDGLLVNGDFETAPSGNGVWAEGQDVESLDGWKIEGTVEYVGEGQRQGNMILVVPHGTHALRLGNDAQISQDIKVEKNGIYSLTLSAARTCAQLESLNVSVLPSSASANIDLQTLYNIKGWDAYAWAFHVPSDQDHVDLVFHNQGMEEDPTCGPVIDNIAIKQISTPDKTKNNLVVNGDFEEGPWMYRNATLGVLLPTNLDVTTSPLPGWIVESNKAVRYIDANHSRVPEGKRAIELVSGKEGIISQMVETEPGKKYSMSFLLGDAGNNCQTPMAVMAFAGDQADNFHYTPPAILAYETNNVTFTAKAERTRIAFYSIYYNTRIVDKSSLCGPVIDQVRVVDLSMSGASALSFSLFLCLCLAILGLSAEFGV